MSEAIPGADALFELATERVAARLRQLVETGGEPGEKAHLQPLVREELRNLQPDAVDSAEEDLPLPNWAGRGPRGDKGPKGVDVLVRWPDGRRRFCAELKLDETGWCLWDLYKMVDALNVPGVEAAYLIVGAPLERFGERAAPPAGMCSELFDGTPEHRSLDLFRRNAKQWTDLLTEMKPRITHIRKTRPTRIPARVFTRLVADPRIRISGKAWELRCIRVGGLPGDPIEFPPADSGWYHGRWPEGEWPLGAPPDESYFEWRGPLLVEGHVREDIEQAAELSEWERIRLLRIYDERDP